MTDETANPPGADDKPLYRTEDIAERLRGLPGREATDETSASVEETHTEAEAPAEAEEQLTETTEPVEEPEAEEQPRGRYKVKVNGEELTVTFDELRNGYQRDSDYRQKTSKLADERRTLEAERAHNAEVLKGIIPALQLQFQDKFANVNWTELAQSDPAKYVALRAEADQAAMRLNQAIAEQNRIEEQTKAQREAEFKEYVSSEKAKLLEKVPYLKDPEKSKAFRDKVQQAAVEFGFTKDDVAKITDHRALLVLHDAALYREAQKAKAQAAKQKPVPQVQKPGNVTRIDPKSAAVSAAQERFSKSGRVDDLAAVLRARRAPS